MLTRDQLGRMIALAEAGRSRAEIAAAIGATPDQVNGALRARGLRTRARPGNRWTAAWRERSGLGPSEPRRALLAAGEFCLGDLAPAGSPRYHHLRGVVQQLRKAGLLERAGRRGRAALWRAAASGAASAATTGGAP